MGDAIRRVEHAEPGHGYFLANLAQDHCETTNLKDSEPRILQELRALHDAWEESVTGLRSLAKVTRRL